MSDYDSFYDMFNDANKHIENLRQEFNKLNLDRCCDIPEIGDTVIVAAGLLGMGYSWIMLEAKVLKTASSVYYVEFLDYKSLYTDKICQWIHPALVVAVVKNENLSV